MLTKKDRMEVQARSFRAAAIGSMISDDTLRVSGQLQKSSEGMVLHKSGARISASSRGVLSLLRDYLRRRRAKRRAKRVDQLKQALVETGIIPVQLAISNRLAVIERELEQLVLTIVKSDQASRVKNITAAANIKSNVIGLDALDFSANMQMLSAWVDALSNGNLIQLPDERVAVRTPYGYVICPRSEYHLIISLSEERTLERGICRVLESLIEPGDHVIDVGAQVGLSTLVMGRAVGASGSVLAIEASQRLVDCIQLTLLTNGLQESCDVLQIAVSDKAGTATFHLPERSGHASLSPLLEESREVQVETAPLDELVPSGDRISLVKIDVKGAELLAMQGMLRILEESPEVVLLVGFGPSHVLRAGQTIIDWLGAFRDRGFDYILEVDEELAICRPVRSESELSKVQSLNLVFARSGSSRIARIPLS